MSWLLLLVATDPGSGLDLPPAEDPVGRWIAVTIAILTVVVPYAIAKVQAKKPVSNGPTPLGVNGGSTTPRLDVGQQYLEQYINNLKDHIAQDAAKYETRLSACEAKNEQLSRQVRDAVEERAVFKTQVESLTADVVELRADNVELRAENRALRSRLNG